MSALQALVLDVQDEIFAALDDASRLIWSLTCRFYRVLLVSLSSACASMADFL